MAKIASRVKVSKKLVEVPAICITKWFDGWVLFDNRRKAPLMSNPIGEADKPYPPILDEALDAAVNINIVDPFEMEYDGYVL